MLGFADDMFILNNHNLRFTLTAGVQWMILAVFCHGYTMTSGDSLMSLINFPKHLIACDFFDLPNLPVPYASIFLNA